MILTQGRKRLVVLLVPLAVVLLRCATVPSEPPPPPNLDGVQITFDHQGAGVDLSQQRIAEFGEAHNSARPGHDYWLALHNGSPFTISFATQSMNFTQPAELVQIGPDKKMLALADGAEAAVLFVSFQGLHAFGDHYGISFLPSGRTVLFSVPRRFLRSDRRIYVNFEAYPEPVLRGGVSPPEYRAYFSMDGLAH